MTWELAWCYRVVLASAASFVHWNAVCDIIVQWFSMTKCRIKLEESLTVNTFWPYTEHRWCYDFKCMSFWVCLKLCATAWNYQQNRCGFAVTGGHISNLIHWNGSYDVMCPCGEHPTIFHQFGPIMDNHLSDIVFTFSVVYHVLKKKLKGKNTRDRVFTKRKGIAWQEEIKNKFFVTLALSHFLSNSCKSAAATSNHSGSGLHAAYITYFKIKTEEWKHKFKV